MSDSLPDNAPGAISKPCLMAAFANVSGAWLNSLIVASLILVMDDNTIRVEVELRVGSSPCRGHSCRHCGSEVDHLATHGKFPLKVRVITTNTLP